MLDKNDMILSKYFYTSIVTYVILTNIHTENINLPKIRI